MRMWRGSFIGLMLVLPWAVPAWADVTVEHAVKSGGLKGMGAFEGTTVSTISALKQRSESTVKFTGAFMSALQRMSGAGEQTVTITRVDKGVVWTLNADKKTYTERPITARAPEPGQPQRQRQPRQDQEKSDVIITKSEFKVERTGAHRTLNGFQCEEYVATWLLETLNQKTQERGRSVMKSNLWTTQETADLRRAREEEQAYHQAYLKKVGIEISPEEARRLGLNMFASFSGASEQEVQRGLAKVSNEWKKVQGYPVLTQVEWTIEGQEGSAGARSRPRQEESGQSGYGGGLGGLLGGLLGGGQGQPSSSSGGGEGGPFILLTTEVKSVKVGPIPESQFEVPSDFVKQ